MKSWPIDGRFCSETYALNGWYDRTLTVNAMIYNNFNETPAIKMSLDFLYWIWSFFMHSVSHMINAYETGIEC